MRERQPDRPGLQISVLMFPMIDEGYHVPSFFPLKTEETKKTTKYLRTAAWRVRRGLVRAHREAG